MARRARRGRRAGKGALLGGIAGALFAPFTGGLSLLGSAALGAGLGAGAGAISGGGKGGKGSKSESRADDLARQAASEGKSIAQAERERGITLSAEERARAEALSQAERARGATLGASERTLGTQTALAERTQAETERQRIERQFARTPEEQAILDSLAKRAGLSGEELVRQLGPITNQLVSDIGQRLNAPPQIPFESTLRPALDLASERIASEANRRGILGSGLQLEQLGRTGADLAIKEAQARQQNAQVNQQLIQETLNRASGLSEFGAGLSDQSIQEQAAFEQALRQQELGGVRLGEDVLQRGLERGFSAEQAGLQRGFGAEEAGLERGFQASGAGLERGFQGTEAGFGRGFQAQEAGLGRQAGFQELGFNALQQRMLEARQRDAAIAQALGSAGLGAITGGVGALPGVAGGFGGVLTGGLQSLTGTGAFSPFSSLSRMLQPQLRVPGYGQTGYLGAGYANYPDLYQQMGGTPASLSSGSLSFLDPSTLLSDPYWTPRRKLF